MNPEDFTSPMLVLGGAKSGKSDYAETVIKQLTPPYIYIATAQVLDPEMQKRVELHRERRSDLWETIESPFELAGTLRRLHGNGRPVLLDCITIWLSNLLCFSSTDPQPALDDLCRAVSMADHPLVIVSNEVGSGIVPENALARKFRDLAGTANQMLARTCPAVVLVTAGLPMRLK